MSNPLIRVPTISPAIAGSAARVSSGRPDPQGPGHCLPTPHAPPRLASVARPQGKARRASSSAQGTFQSARRGALLGAALTLFLLGAGITLAGDACCPPRPAARPATSTASTPASPPRPAGGTVPQAGPTSAAPHFTCDHDHAPAPAKAPATPESHQHGPTGRDDHGHPTAAPSAPAPVDPHAGHAHGADDGHGHGAVDFGPRTLAHLSEPACEHGIKTIACDICRYKLGVVKVTGSAAALIHGEPVAPGQDRQMVNVTGELALDDNRVFCLTPRFAGLLASITLRVGDPVRAGQPLFVLESHELAEAALALLKRRAEADLAAKRHEREKMLHDRQIGSAQDAQEARAALDLARLEVENARRRLALFGLPAGQVAALEKGSPTRLTAGEFVVTSPLAGRVLERAGNVGDRVAGDKEVLKVADLTHLAALVQVHEQDLGAVLAALAAGPLPAEVTVDAFPGRVFEARALQADLQISRETRTLPVRLEVENPDELLRPGMFIRGRLLLGDRRAAVSLPLAALQEDAGQAFVFVRLTDDLYVRRDVRPGPRLGDRVAIEEGLQAGEVVAVEGPFLLKSDVLREKMGAGCAD